jgi:hypothetical protein
MAAKVFRAISANGWLQKLAQCRATLPVCFAVGASCLLKSGNKAILENKASVMLAPFQICTRERI